MSAKKLLILIVLCLIVFLFGFSSCSSSKENPDFVSIGVFVPGIVSGSPVYEMLSNGVVDAVKDYNQKIEQDGSSSDVIKKAQVEIIEAGVNQAEWSSKMTGIVASGKYEVIITSNPSMPDIIAPLTSKFPKQKFIILDATLSGNKNVATVLYNQREQSFLAGYIAALVAGSSSDDMQFSNGQKKIALVAAQEYPVMNNIILPGFTEGAKAADKDTVVDFRIVGNWTDASKASEIARQLYQSGTRVILPITGGAAQGVISTAKELGFYITWFDDNGFQKAPGYVISSSVMQQYRAAYESAIDYLNGVIEFGSAAVYGISEGYIDLVQDDPLYIQAVDEEIRSKVAEVYQKIKSKEIDLSIK